MRKITKEFPANQATIQFFSDAADHIKGCIVAVAQKNLS